MAELLINNRFLRFCCIGGLGFVVDSGITYGLVGLGFPSLAARIPAILIALTVCYKFHHGFTFRKEGKAPWRGWYKFLVSNSIGSSVNYGCYAVVLLVWPVAPLILPLAVGSGVALIVNYTLSTRYVFR
ncbi:GtrA family protein [Desulfovibrio sp. UCD-KL4C]|uniref:GtrA family protein n=1 Tax=Desulfovibrio sp. UCD-KL4C TaxID=2578120 RepID=UPI0025BCEFE6|nr:GtrA family protein [Desulfovibrio sp. UCD-KL4C]